MRTTLDIADDVLLAAKGVARRDNRSIGEVISELARSALVSAPAAAPGSRRAPTLHAGLVKLGIVPLPRRGGLVTNDLITRLRDDGIY